MKAVPGTRFGFVSIIGLPNAGKSTLVNALVGSKVSIVSRKVQTTRNRILGLLTHEKTQIALMDTPGVFAPKKTLERHMVKAALSALADSDAVLHIVDIARKDPLSENRDLIDKLPDDKPVFLALNKIDCVNRMTLLDILKQFNDAFSYQDSFLISAKKSDGLDVLVKTLAAACPESPWHFEEDQITDMPNRFMAAEITREKVFHYLHQELPYDIMVVTDSWERFDNGSLKIHQTIFVQRDSQKGIVIGKKGAQLKKIGQEARLELGALLETSVHLNIRVKVQENWSERPENYLF